MEIWKRNDQRFSIHKKGGEIEKIDLLFSFMLCFLLGLGGSPFGEHRAKGNIPQSEV